MTITANHVCMCAIESKVGLCVVIENCDHPLVAGVACTAISTKRTSMYIIVAVTSSAVIFCIIKLVGQVTTPASCRRVHTGKRER